MMPRAASMNAMLVEDLIILPDLSDRPSYLTGGWGCYELHVGCSEP